MLWHGIELDLGAAGPDVTDLLRYLIPTADHRIDALAHMHYRVVRGGDGLVVEEEGDHLETVSDPEAVLDLIYRRVHQRAFELASLRGWVRLHAAVIDVVGPDPDEAAAGSGGARLLLVAPSGTGKTTLACRLLLDGQAAVADESTLVRDGVALPVARRFHLKPGLEDVVAGLADHTVGLPALADGSVRAFDPGEAGFAWVIDERPVDHVVLVERLEPRAPGPPTPASQDVSPASSLESASAVEAMPVLVDQSFPHQEPTGELLRQVAILLPRGELLAPPARFAARGQHPPPGFARPLAWRANALRPPRLGERTGSRQPDPPSRPDPSKEVGCT